MINNPLETKRHSAAHLLAAAVTELYPSVKLGVGPAVEDGFYYDLLLPTALSEEDLPKIEEKMGEIQRRDEKFVREEMSLAEAIKLFKKNKQDFKVELLSDLKKRGTTKVRPEETGEVGDSIGVASIYRTGSFVDLCRGPHVASSKEICPFKLTKVAGAYWRGDEKKPQLQRVYGIAFETQNELGKYLVMLEEAKKRDHRKLGRELELFIFSDYVGPGLPLWLPKGAVLCEVLEKLAKETERLAGYQQVRTPHIAKEIMYKTSGHLPYYAESMFPPMVMEEDGRKEVYYMKAMNCPHHHQIYASQPRSYRDLPLRLSEYGACYRYEKSGELFGLMRARMLSMNDAHIYCTEEQFESEFQAVNEMYLKYFKLFGLEKYVMRFSTHDPAGLGKKYVDEPELWKKTEDMVRRVLIKNRINFVEAPNEAAFYGPKIDVQVWSSIGHEFTLATNQVDFAVPTRFALTYTDAEGKEKTPIVIHRAPLGTHERTVGFLIEHYAGAFPMWLAPVQVRLATVGEDFISFAKDLLIRFEEAGLRADLDVSDEKVGKKVRNAAMMKIPWTVVIGAKEAAGGDFKINVFGQEEDLVVPAAELVTRAVAAGKIPN
jgi:threonyl-tRNA synthetase